MGKGSTAQHGTMSHLLAKAALSPAGVNVNIDGEGLLPQHRRLTVVLFWLNQCHSLVNHFQYNIGGLRGRGRREQGKVEISALPAKIGFWPVLRTLSHSSEPLFERAFA
jgi:hypothetical protein